MNIRNLLQSFRWVFGVSLLWLITGNVQAQGQLLAENDSHNSLIKNQKIDKQSLRDVLDQIKDKKQVLFVYESKVVKDKEVAISVNYEQEVEAILKSILPPLGLTHKKMRHGTFAIRMGGATKNNAAKSREIQRVELPGKKNDNQQINGLSTQSRLERIDVSNKRNVIDFTVTGFVKNDKGEGLEGATVRHKEGVSGAIAGLDGKFSVTLPSGTANLIVSYIGYKTQEIPVNNRNNIDIVMVEDLNLLDEVVVVGYGTQVRREITGNIASVKGEDLLKVPSLSIDQGLQGMAAGVQVASASGVAGAPVRVMVRGTNSISTSTEPLYVIDGMIVGSSLGTSIRSSDASPQNPLANINPNDVESIEVLKDAAATAIYGSRGSNGVIIVTTKSGKSGKGELSVNYQTGVTNLLRHPDEFMIQSGDEWMNLIETARSNSGLDPITDDQFFVRQDLYNSNEESFTLTPQEARQNSANWDEMLNTGAFQEVNLSTSRGYEGGSFFISANYRDEQGVLGNETLDAGNRFQRLSARINADLKPFSSFTLGTRTTLAYTNNERISPGGGGGPGGNVNTATPGFGIASTHRPVYPVLKDGRLFDPRSGNNFRATMDPANLRNQAYTYRALSSVFANYEVPFVPGLSFRTEASADVQLEHGIFWGNTILREESPYAFDDQVTNTNILVNLLGNYNRSFGDHKISATVGTERQTRTFRAKRIEGDGLFGTAQEVGAPGNILRLGGFANTGPNFLSYFGRINYNFAGRYLLGVSFRRDGSSAFLEQGRFIGDNTWSNFPGVSAGWILSEEDFLKNNNLIDFLKVRASYGRTGNAGIPSNLDLLGFADWGRYGSRGNNVNGGSLLTNIPAQGITWETTDALDAGFDFELLNSRISGSLAYFQQDVSGLILQVPVPPSSGLFNSGSVWANIGEMRNQGWEFSFTSYNITNRDFTWNTSFNFTWNTNEIISLAPEIDANENGINSGITTTVAGGILGEFFLARYAGLNEFGGYPEIYEIDRDQFMDDGVTPNPNWRQETGEVIPADRNEVRNHKQRTGKSGLPKYFGGINNTLGYKGFELNFQFVFQGGNWIFDNVERGFSRVGGGGSNLLASMLDDTWTPENLDARHPQLTWNNRYDTYNEDGSVNRTNQRFDYRGDQYHDQYLQRGDFLRLRTFQLAYTFPGAVLERLKLSNLRIFATGTNLLTITGYDGIDPEQAIISGNRNLTQGVFGMQMPPLQMFSGGISLGF